MKIGAHVSSAGSLDKAIDRAQEIGAETLQIFVSSPRSWIFNPIPAHVSDAYTQKAKSTGIYPTFLHSIYLASLGAGTNEHLEKSVQALINYMDAANQIEAAGVIFHAGSHRGTGFGGIFDQAVSSMDKVLNSSPANVWLAIENSAGMGDHICSAFQEIGQLANALASPQVKVCLDTQHLFAAGYDITREAGLERVLEEFEKEIGLSRLVAVHANDSKTPFASGVDRHENLGHGHMGLEPFRVMMNHPVFENIPFILEVPGIDGNGPDKANIDILKALRHELGPVA